MRRPVKIVVWVVAFVAAAAAGAYVAAHTDPFPPGVADPGERPTPTATVPTSPPPQLRRWQLAARVESQHVLHVGGACRSDWDVQALVRERSDGSVAGSALATLHGEGGCDFPTAAVQTQTLTVAISGRVRPTDPLSMRLLFEAPGNADPVGSTDLGAFDVLVPGFSFAIVPTSASRVATGRPDGNEGRFAMVWHARISCVAGCR